MYSNKSTIQDIITMGKEDKMTINELTLKQVITNSSGEKFIINVFNLFEKYYELLLDNTVTAVLSEEEYNKYKYNPRLLSQDLYGTKELHFLLLRLNHIYSVINFDFKEVRVFTNNIVSLLNEIMVIEAENFDENAVDIIKRVNE